MTAIIEGMMAEYLFAELGKIDGIPVYSTPEEADLAAKEAGIEGHHEHEKDGQTVYMPGSTHSEATDALLRDEFAALDEQQIVVGPLMVPNKLIKRMDENGEYYVYFTDDTIKKLAYKSLKDKIIDRVNIEHDGEDKVNAYMVESWLKEDDEDKSKKYGYGSLPVGS